MATETAPTSTAAAPLVEQRLNEIERLLFGLLPRNERLALMATLEDKVRAAGVDGAAELPLTAPGAGREHATSTGRRRSMMALAAGIFGILALVLLAASPITFVFLELAGEILGEMGAIIIALMHSGLLALGGTLAMGLGMVALFRLMRKRGQTVGYGWAITGICTGPIPMLIGGLVLMMVGFAVFESELIVAQVVPSQPPVTTTVMPTSGVAPATMPMPTLGPAESAPAMLPPPGYDPAPANGTLPPAGPAPSDMPPSLPAAAPTSENQPAAPPADNPTLQYTPPPVSPATPPVLPEAPEKADLPKPETKPEVKAETKEPAAQTETTEKKEEAK